MSEKEIEENGTLTGMIIRIRVSLSDNTGGKNIMTRWQFMNCKKKRSLNSDLLENSQKGGGIDYF
jgi:hypothetical protein